MKALIIAPKDQSEFKFLSILLERLNVNATAIKATMLEDISLSKLLTQIDKTKKTKKKIIMNKLK